MLDGLNDDDLRAVDARCLELLKQHDIERKETAMAQARATLAAVGLTFKDVAGGKVGSKPAKGPAYHTGHQYQHPTNKALVWKATGQKPNWLRELEAKGGKAMEVGLNVQNS